MPIRFDIPRVLAALAAAGALLLSAGAIADPGHGPSDDRGAPGGYGQMSGPEHMMDRHGGSERARDKGPETREYRGHSRMGHHHMDRGRGYDRDRHHMGSGRDGDRHHMESGRGHSRMGHSRMGHSRMGQSGMGRRPGHTLSVDDVKKIVEGRLAWRGNPNLKLGKVEMVKDGEIAFEIVTRDGSLVRRWLMDPKTGLRRPADREPAPAGQKPAPRK